jgi:hypothetical protein
MEASVEVGDRDTGTQVEGPDPSVSGLNDEGGGKEVNANLERRVVVVQAAGGEPAGVDVERGVPPVVARRCRGQPDLSDDLRVEVQGVLGRTPVDQVQFRQGHVESSTKAMLSR